jgi:hypothetical protein
MPSRDKLAEFTAWCSNHITGDEKGRRKSSWIASFKVSDSPAVST